EEPGSSKQMGGLDFGQGFYLTTDENRARLFSKTAAIRNGGETIVNVYNFDLESASKALSIRVFKEADMEWLLFVKDNRLKIYDGPFYDAIIGKAVDDDAMPTLQAYLIGFTDEEATLHRLKTRELPDQICVRSEEGLSWVKFVRAYRS
ncbi:MAG: DUF3990 domain-containing protein, partial [Clostridiales bacterium]|nr:DUF3990 domain-containing protein [Clostridiales bacterium]